MKNKLFVILTVIGLSSCYSNRLKYGEFKIDGKKHNNLIVNRIPHYGINAKDGCVVHGQMAMNLTYFSKDSIAGQLINPNTENPILFSEIKLITVNSDSIRLFSNENGRFHSKLNDQLYWIKTNLIGYKSLVVDLRTYYK